MLKLRQGIILISTALYLAYTLNNDWKQVIYLLIYSAIEFVLAFGYIEIRKKYGKIGYQYGIVLVLALTPLILCKISAVLPISVFNFLGISYLTFRVVQIIIETYDGIITKLNIPEFFAYLLFFPTFVCGPIDRSRRFSDDWNKKYTRAEYLDLVGIGIEKILLGVVYKFALAYIVYEIIDLLGDSNSIWYVIAYAYCYGIHMFFDFAGYSNIAIGIGYLLGIKVPENFNKPFISKDMKDFWDRWHMSLSYWFRDFLFSRFIMRSIRKKWFKNKLTGASIGFLINMFVMGIWHGLKADYILYGLYHGILLALTEIYQKKSKFHKKNKNNRAYKIVSWFITINLVMLGFLIFSGRFLEIICSL